MRIERGMVSMIVVAALCFAVPAAARGAPGDEVYDITFGDGKPIQIKRVDQANWSAEADGRTYSLRTDQAGRFTFSSAGEQDITGNLKDRKIKMMRGREAFMEVKLKPGKIKVNPTGREADEWNIKFKEEKIKVSRLDIEMGKIKYYPEANKLKAKDTRESEVAVCKGVGRLSAALAPFLMTESMRLDQRLFLVLLFFALDR